MELLKFENPTHVATSKYESTENQLKNRHLSDETQQLMNIVITWEKERAATPAAGRDKDACAESRARKY